MFETITAFFVGLLLMPFVFYGLVIAFFLAIAIGIEDSFNKDGEGWGWATLGSAGLIWLGCFNFGITIEEIKQAPSLLFYGVGAYIVAGIVWSIGKWYFKLVEIRDKYKELKAEFVEQHKVHPEFLSMPDVEYTELNKQERIEYDSKLEVIQDFIRKVASKMRTYKDSVSPREVGRNPQAVVDCIKPVAAKHKSTITQWIAFWPISLTWTIINDPVRKTANYIFSRIKGIYGRMSDAMFAGV